MTPVANCGLWAQGYVPVAIVGPARDIKRRGSVSFHQHRAGILKTRRRTLFVFFLHSWILFNQCSVVLV